MRCEFVILMDDAEVAKGNRISRDTYPNSGTMPLTGLEERIPTIQRMLESWDLARLSHDQECMSYRTMKSESFYLP